VRKALYFAAVFAALACATVAFGYGSLVSSFKAPGEYPWGIGWASWRDSGFWVSCSGNDYRYRMTTTGSIYASFPNPGTGSTGCGAANINGVGYVFVVGYGNKYAYRIGMAAGSIYGSWPAPGLLPRGIDYCGDGGNYVYYIERNGRVLYFMHAYTGSIYRMDTLDFIPGDVAYDPRGYLWITAPHAGLVLQCTTTGSAIDSFWTTSYGDPSGCGCDGTYVYVGVSTSYPRSTHNVLKFETSGVGIAPASLGKVKALFR
jgi:hypothetical protein